VGEAEVEREAELIFANRQAAALEQDFGEGFGDIGVGCNADFPA
jgi:hypothetical protein